LVTTLSVELPEAHILAEQMNTELAGKEVAACNLQNCTNYQHLGFINTYLSDFNRLHSQKVEFVASRGNTIRVKLDGNMNLILAPEYGGIILYHAKGAVLPKKYTLKLTFTDESALTDTLTGMGIIHALTDEELSGSYVYRRDFSATADPLEADLTFERFQTGLARKNVNLKTALVGKDASVVGLGNAAFQDIIYRAALHPRRKTGELTVAEQKALFEAVNAVVAERIKLGGKEQFVDLYGKPGAYVAAMGPNMKGQPCKRCGSGIVKISFGGGQVYLCPACQK
jgi:formamidopyrimidine-DNA glycosylase